MVQASQNTNNPLCSACGEEEDIPDRFQRKRFARMLARYSIFRPHLTQLLKLRKIKLSNSLLQFAKTSTRFQ